MGLAPWVRATPGYPQMYSLYNPTCSCTILVTCQSNVKQTTCSSPRLVLSHFHLPWLNGLLLCVAHYSPILLRIFNFHHIWTLKSSFVQRENNEESEKDSSSSKLFSEYTFPTAKLILTSSCSIVRDSAVPTEGGEKRSELNSVIAFAR